MAERLRRAATIYRRLSGMWSDRGEYGYAGWAYVRARRLEREALRPGGAHGWHRAGQWAFLVLADATSGFGERVRRVAITALLLVVVPGVVYAATGAIEDGGRTTHDLGDGLLFSLGQVTTTAPDRFSAPPGVELAGAVQTLVGIVLLGLLGFVLGNRIRSS
jgi:hypothetical protein